MFFTVGRDVGALDEAETKVKDLLLSSSFDLRAHAQNTLAAASLLSGHAAAAGDAEASFLVGAMNSSCNLLLGAPPALAQRAAACASLCRARVAP